MENENTVLKLIIKLTARGHINCSYRYHFNDNNQAWQLKPAYRSDDVLLSLIRFVKEAIASTYYSLIKIDLHGGEPLLLGKEKISWLCQQLNLQQSKKTAIKIAVQTHALLIDKEWVRLFRQYNIQVEVSPDGTENIHDENRRTKQGYGTYQKTLQGIYLLQAAVKQQQLDDIGVICVINEKHNVKNILHHFIDILQLKLFHFILPDATHDGKAIDIASYTEYLINLVKVWQYYCWQGIEIRIIDKFLENLFFHCHEDKHPIHALTIQSDGQIYPDDTLRNTLLWQQWPYFNSLADTASDVINSTAYQQLQAAIATLPDNCKSCNWRHICQGGMPLHRYSNAKQFNNSSIYCLPLQSLYNEITKVLLSSGFTNHDIMHMLNPLEQYA